MTGEPACFFDAWIDRVDELLEIYGCYRRDIQSCPSKLPRSVPHEHEKAA